MRRLDQNRRAGCDASTGTGAQDATPRRCGARARSPRVQQATDGNADEVAAGDGTRPMHELAIAESVVSSVLERTGEQHVSVVRLRIGRLAGVVPDALSFCFELATAGTPLEGAALEIVEEHGRAHCRTCDTDFDLDDA